MRSYQTAVDILESVEIVSPPSELREWVGGQTREIFETVGKNVALNLFDVVEPLGILNSKDSAVLDFGCGCGRVARYFHALFPNTSYYGVDPDGRGIQWAQENLSHIGKFIQSKTRPPLNVDRNFDFVYATSVFTHLPENLQMNWLVELCRVTRSGGYLVLSTHGENIIPEEMKAEFFSREFVYRDANYNLIGADYYDAVWHTKKYVKENWGKYFEIVKHIDQGINNHQDLVLCRKK